jgi:hypothetical protein
MAFANRVSGRSFDCVRNVFRLPVSGRNSWVRITLFSRFMGLENSAKAGIAKIHPGGGIVEPRGKEGIVLGPA